MTFGKGVSRNGVTCFKEISMSVRENRTYCEKNRIQCLQQCVVCNQNMTTYNDDRVESQRYMSESVYVITFSVYDLGVV